MASGVSRLHAIDSGTYPAGAHGSSGVDSKGTGPAVEFGALGLSAPRYDPKHERYLVLIAFENEIDAQKLAQVLGAKRVSDYSGFASQRAFREPLKKSS